MRDAQLRIGRAVFKGEGLRDQPTEMLTSKIFNTISAYLCSCSCQYCYHIKQKHCIISPKAFSVTQKVLKRHLWLGLSPGHCWGRSWPSRPPQIP